MDQENINFIDDIRNNEKVEMFNILFSNSLLEENAILYALTILRNKYKFEDEIYYNILKDVLNNRIFSDEFLIELIKVSNSTQVIELVVSIYGYKDVYNNVITKVVNKRVFSLGVYETTKIVSNSFVNEFLLEIILFKALDLYSKNYSEYKDILNAIYNSGKLTSKLLCKIIEYFGKNEVLNVLSLTSDEDVMLYVLKYVKTTYGIYDKLYQKVTELLLDKDYLVIKVMQEIAFSDPEYIGNDLNIKSGNNRTMKIIPFVRKKKVEGEND